MFLIAVKDDWDALIRLDSAGIRFRAPVDVQRYPRMVGEAVKRPLADKTYVLSLGAESVETVAGIGSDSVLTALLG